MLEAAKLNFMNSSQILKSTKKILCLDDQPYNINALESIFFSLNLGGGRHDLVDSCFYPKEALTKLE